VLLYCKQKMQFSFVLIDDSGNSTATLAAIKNYEAFLCVAICSSKVEGINKVLKLKPNIVFLSIGSTSTNQSHYFSLISELHEYLVDLPTIIVLSTTKEAAYEAYQRGVSGYLVQPIDDIDLQKCLMRYQKTHKSLAAKISIKSNGDYHFINPNDIIYLKADSNTTDFYLTNGKVISAFKTLKHFEQQLPFYFFRIHHSYLINIEYVSRINLGKCNCYLDNNEIVLPFSRTYKDNIDAILVRIS
jgi:DNA-binding LytR/AlgR family response regulator